MKTHLKGILKGEIIAAKVFEKLSAYEYIVSVDGQLIQVQNQTLKDFEVGGVVHLQVLGIQPLQFRLLVPGEKGARRNIDLSV